MNCCNDCNPIDEKTYTQEIDKVQIPIGRPNNGNISFLRGKKFILINAKFSVNGVLKDLYDYAVKLSNIGELFVVSIYRKHLPFDSLVVQIQFNPNTGDYLVTSFSMTDFDMVELELNGWKEANLGFRQFAPSIYRVTNIGGVHNLIAYRKLSNADKDKLLMLVTLNSQCDVWPMMIGFSNGPFIRTTGIEIPEWKNDAAW